MRVVVTGAGGRLGRLVVKALAQRGVESVGTDLNPGPGLIQADLTDLGHVHGVLARADAVIHLGAIPSPNAHTGQEVFYSNTMSTFNVFEAAANLGIKRAVFASSLSAYGYPFQRVWSEPHYFPLDEAHPLVPQDPYGLSKQVGEQIAATYSRATAGVAVSLRFSHLVNDDTMPRWQAGLRDNPRGWASSLWSHVYDTDVADACLRALTAPLQGHTAMLLAGAAVTAERSTDDLLDEYFPAVPRRSGTDPHWSLVDCSLATELIGWDPK